MKPLYRRVEFRVFCSVRPSRNKLCFGICSPEGLPLTATLALHHKTNDHQKYPRSYSRLFWDGGEHLRRLYRQDLDTRVMGIATGSTRRHLRGPRVNILATRSLPSAACVPLGVPPWRVMPFVLSTHKSASRSSPGSRSWRSLPPKIRKPSLKSFALLARASVDQRAIDYNLRNKVRCAPGVVTRLKNAEVSSARTCLVSILIRLPLQEGRLLFVSYAGALCIQSGYNVVQDCINQLPEPSEKRVKNELPPTTLPSPLPQQVSPPSDVSAASQARFMNQFKPGTPTYSQPSPQVTRPPPYIPETPSAFSNSNGLSPFRQAGSAFQKQRPPPTTEPESAPPTNARLADFVFAPEPPTKARIVDGLTRPPRSLRPLGTSSGFIVLAAPFAGPCGSMSRRTSLSPSPLYSPPRPRNPFLAAVRLLQISITRLVHHV